MATKAFEILYKVKQSNDYVHNQEIRKSLIETQMQVCDNAYKPQQTTKF